LYQALEMPLKINLNTLILYMHNAHYQDIHYKSDRPCLLTFNVLNVTKCIYIPKRLCPLTELKQFKQSITNHSEVNNKVRIKSLFRPTLYTKANQDSYPGDEERFSREDKQPLVHEVKQQRLQVLSWRIRHKIF